MPFPLKSLEELTREQEAHLETAMRNARPDIDPAAIARSVRSSTGLLAVIARTNAQALFNNHLHLRWWGDQYLPDTADDEFLLRHANIWGVFRRPAVQAVGNVSLTGQAGLAVPSGLQMTNVNAALIETTAGGVIPGSGVIILPVRAVSGGASGNAAGLSALPLVTTLPGLDPQSATADASGLQGGAETEDDAALLLRVLARIQQPPHGGAGFDYQTWVLNRFAACKVSVVTGWVGRGSVGVIVAMGTSDAPRVATPAELADILAYLGPVNGAGGVRPVTAEVVPVAHLPRAINLTIAVSPDTAAVRTAVTAALQGYFTRDAQIGQPVPLSRMSEAISAAAGEYKHIISAPAADVACAPRELAGLGLITWAAYP